MATTPKKLTTPRGAENTPDLGSQKKDAPWSKSKVDRFTGHGSYLAQALTPSKANVDTPSKQLSSSLMKGERYGTPAERRARAAPTQTPTSGFASATDRFSGKTPGSVYGATAASVPGVGEYNPSTAQKVKGATKLQAAYRRRQSRGIFAAAEKLARQVPSPGKYDAASTIGGGPQAPSAHTLSSVPRFGGQTSIYNKAGAAPDAGDYAGPVVAPPAVGGVSFAHGAQRPHQGSIYPTEATPGVGEYEVPAAVAAVAREGGTSSFAPGKERFEGGGSIYPTERTPGVGEYDAPQAGEAKGAGFAHGAARFEGAGLHGSIYPTAATPGVGAYEVDGPAAAAAPPTASAAFQSGAERFAGPGSLYAPSAAPGVGLFAPDEAKAAHDAKGSVAQATFASATDRFDGKTPGSVYGATAACVPGAGEYTPATDERIKGVIKLQAVARRRMSRGIFAAREKVAAGVPSPGKYETGGQWSAGAVDFGRGPERFAQGSIYKKAILVESAAPLPGLSG